jgi:hypothetical protein
VRFFAAVVGAVLALVTGAAPAAAQEDADVGDVVSGTRVVVVGVPGLRWDDVDRFRAPTLERLSGTAATGVLSVKARPALSCPADGWLTLAAGARADRFDLPCRLPDEPDPHVDVDDLAARNADTRDAADVRALAGALRDAGLCLAALGPGAELAGGDPARACPVALVDAPAVSGADGARSAAVATVDALVADVDAARSPGSTLVVVGVSGAPGDDRAHLHVALAEGPGVGEGALRSASTRRTPYVQLVDVAPTVLDVLGVPPTQEMIGQPWRSVAGKRSASSLADLDRRAVEAKRAQVPFFVTLVGGLLVALGVAAWRRSWRLAEWVGLTGVCAVTGSYLVGLAPWWRAPEPAVGLVAGAALVGVVGATLARRVPGRVGPVAVATGALALVLLVDLLTGARLQLDAPAGYSPLVAGRFAGLGNVAFGVLAAAVLLALAAATARRPADVALVAVVAGGGLAVVVVGGPPWGSDVGGVLALVPGVVTLAVLRSGRRMTLLRLVLAGLAGAAVVTALALADAARPEDDRTHLGRFVEQVRDGTFDVVLVRKAEAIGNLLFANPATALLPVVVAAAVWLVVRPPGPLRAAFADVPAWRHGLLALGVTAAVGFLANDSGPAIPALALLVAIPATLAVTARRGQVGAGDG